MDKVLQHYLEFSIYTNPGLYKDMLKNDLPDDIKEIGLLVRKNIIHRTTLEAGNTGTNADLKFGDMSKVPWYRQPEDDILATAAAMLAELYRRNEKGFIPNREEKDKLVLTCRFVAILMASILKSKDIPCRVRSGNAPYFDTGDMGKLSTDHWINQYWNKTEKRWVTVDVDGSLSLKENNFDPYDIPTGIFDFPAEAWLKIRNNQDDPQRFYNAKPEKGLIVVLWSLFYDFHSLMNNEIIYLHTPAYGTYEGFSKLAERDLKKIDDLADLMRQPDNNFEKLKEIFENDKDFRLLTGSLL